MSKHHACTAILAAAFAAACGDDSSGPSGTTHGDIVYTATVNEVTSSTSRQFSVSVTLRNTGNVTATRRHPVGCAAVIRLYRFSDNALLYDESKRPCPSTDSATVTIPAGSSVQLSTGLRFPMTITDSLPTTRYRVRAVMRTEPGNPFEVVAGDYQMPDCQVSTGAGFPQTICT